LIISPSKISTDSSAWFEYNKNIPKEEKTRKEKGKKKDNTALNFNISAFFKFNMPVLFKLGNIKKENNAVEYAFKCDLFNVEGQAQVISKGNENFAFLIVKSDDPSELEKSTVTKYTREDIKMLRKRRTAVRYVQKSLPEPEKRDIKVVLKLNCVEKKFDVKGYVSVLVDLLPATADQDNSGFSVNDVFVLMNGNEKVQIMNKLLCVVKDGARTARLLIKSPKMEDTVVLEAGHVFGEAQLVQAGDEQTIGQAFKLSLNMERWYDRILIDRKNNSKVRGKKRRNDGENTKDGGSAKKMKPNDQKRNADNSKPKTDSKVNGKQQKNASNNRANNSNNVAKKSDNRGNNRDNRGNNRDNRGNNRDNRGNNRDNRGNNRDNRGNNRDNRGNNRDNRGNNRGYNQRDNRVGRFDNRQVARPFMSGGYEQRSGAWQNQRNQQETGLLINHLVTALSAATQQQQRSGMGMGAGMMNPGAGGGRSDILYEREMALKREEERIMRMRRALERDMVTNRMMDDAPSSRSASGRIPSLMDAQYGGNRETERERLLNRIRERNSMNGLDRDIDRGSYY